MAIDHAEEKIYWIDDVEGIQVKIERSNIDGSGREVLVHLRRQQPDYLAVDDRSIYWTDVVSKAVWTAPKDANPGNVPTQFKSYFSSHPDDDPAGIVARDNAGRIDCPAIAKISQRANFLNASSPRTTVQSFNNLITSTEESDLTTESSKYCFNDGHVNKTDGRCRCRLGSVFTLFPCFEWRRREKTPRDFYPVHGFGVLKIIECSVTNQNSNFYSLSLIFVKVSPIDRRDSSEEDEL